MPAQGHTGAREPSPFAQPVDRRVVEMDDALRAVEVAAQVVPQLAFMRDSMRAAQAHMQSLGFAGHWVRGMVVHALPYYHWYKVQCGDGFGWQAACKLESCGLVPVGPRNISPLPPGSLVMLYLPKGFNYGFIAGAVPPMVAEGKVVCPDWVVQGGNSGIKREDAHKFPIKNLYKEGGVRDFSSQRPQDATAFEEGWVTPTGLAVTIDDFFLQVRVNEMCGLFMSWYDSWCRLAGVQLHIESSIHEEACVEDEGEAHYFRGYATYPWEGIGLYDSGTDIAKEYTDKEVQYTKAVGKVDLPEGEEDVQPLYRAREYGGYMGQGYYREVVKPAKQSGKRKFKDDASPPDEGLFREHIGLDGSYCIASAKRLAFLKRCKLVSPWQKKLPEDQNGDDQKKNNYKFSGKTGGGPEHKMKQITVNGQQIILRTAAAANDLMAYLVNWQALHPFHYHKNDFTTKQESETTDFSKTTEAVGYGTLATEPFITDPSPKKLHIDHRYGDVDYFERESFLIFHDNGTVQMGGACGEHILMGGGDLEFSAPGKLKLLPGTDLIAFASQMCFRSKGSIDLSSSHGDFRAKAQKNMQLLAGNGGTGTLLLDGRGKGTKQKFDQKYGEDVDGGGIVAKAQQGVLGLLGNEVYMRSGAGDITIDANKNKKKLYLKGSEITAFVDKGVQFYFITSDNKTSTSCKKVYYFGEQNAIMDSVKLLLGGKLISYKNGGAVLKGGCYGLETFATAGVMADNKGMFLGKVPGGFAAIINAICAAVDLAVQAIRKGGEAKHDSAYVFKWYIPQELGDDPTAKNVAFSFRDPPASAGKQYKTEKLKWPETHWQTLSRLGAASGGAGWDETPVSYQGTPTYPYPGKKKWLEDSQVFLQLQQFNMFRPGPNVDHDRPGPYEDPRLADWQPGVTFSSGYKLIR